MCHDDRAPFKDALESGFLSSDVVLQIASKPVHVEVFNRIRSISILSLKFPDGDDIYNNGFS